MVQGGTNIITSNLQFYFDAANGKSYPGTGSVWYDLSGNGRHGTLINSPTYNSGNNGNFDFNGTSQYVQLGATYALSGATGLSIFAWQRKDSASTGVTKCIVSSENNAVNGGIVFQNHSSGPNAIQCALDSDNSGSYSGAELLYSTQQSLETWDYVGLVYNAGGMKCYVNGVEDGSLTGLSSTLTINKTWFIGYRGIGGASAAYYDGKISVVQIYSVPLTASEVLQNYNATKGRYL
jgi:hypothetical protein